MTCNEELATTTTLTTARASPTHSHSHPTIRPSSIWDHPKDIGPTWDSHILPAPLHTLTDVGEAEGPHPPTAKSWCGLLNPVWFVFKSLHQPNRQDHGTPLEGAQVGLNIREHSPVRGSRTWTNAWDKLEGSKSGWFPSILPPEMCIGSLAHLHRTPDNEPWRVPLTIRVQPLILKPAAVWLHYHHHCMLVTFCAFTDIIIYYYYSNIIIVIIIFFIIITIIPYLTSPSVTNSRHFCV